MAGVVVGVDILAGIDVDCMVGVVAGEDSVEDHESVFSIPSIVVEFELFIPTRYQL